MRHILAGIVLLALVVISYIIFSKFAEKPLSNDREVSELDNQIADLELSQIKSSPQRFNSAEEAFKASKEAVEKYDIEFIESFTLPVNCSWCNEFYNKIRNLLLTEELTSEAKNFYAELLAVSGNPSNLDFLLELYASLKTSSDKEFVRNALELIVANDEVLEWLGEKLNSVEDPALKESILAGITNQDSVKAIEILYDYLLKSPDPSSDDLKGLGLSEAVPPDEALGFLVEKFKASDSKYRKYIAAAILNNGLEGIKKFSDLLATDEGKLLVSDFEYLSGHVVFDPEIEAYLTDVLNKGNDTQKLFAKTVIDSFNSLRDELEQGPDGEDNEEDK